MSRRETQFADLFRADWKPTRADIARAYARVGLSTEGLEREPGDDEEPELIDEDEGELIPLSEMLTEIRSETAAKKTIDEEKRNARRNRNQTRAAASAKR